MLEDERILIIHHRVCIFYVQCNASHIYHAIRTNSYSLSYRYQMFRRTGTTRTTTQPHSSRSVDRSIGDGVMADGVMADGVMHDAIGQRAGSIIG
jgi:hypothetical protein